MSRGLGPRAAAVAVVAMALAACVPVTVNISIPQERLDAAARQIEEAPASPPAPGASAPAPPPAPAPTPAGGRRVDVTPRLDTRSPEIARVSESRRQRRPALREWKGRGCLGETSEGLVVARPGDGCGAEVEDLIRAENADRQTIYAAFIRDNHIPASDTARVRSAFAKAHQERARPNDWIQLDDGQWVRKQ